MRFRLFEVNEHVLKFVPTGFSIARISGGHTLLPHYLKYYVMKNSNNVLMQFVIFTTKHLHKELELDLFNKLTFLINSTDEHITSPWQTNYALGQS